MLRYVDWRHQPWQGYIGWECTQSAEQWYKWVWLLGMLRDPMNMVKGIILQVMTLRLRERK